MPKCTKCDREVVLLVNRVAEVHFYDLTLDGDCPSYEETSFETFGQGDFRCPQCQELLFSDLNAALAFLKEVPDATKP